MPKYGIPDSGIPYFYAGARAAYYEQILSSYNSVGAYMVPGSCVSQNTAAMVLAKNLFCKPYEIGVRSQYDTLVGGFTGKDRKAYMLGNYTDPIRKCTGTVTLVGNGVTELRLYKDGKESLLTAENGFFTVTLEPGGCAFAVW